MAKPVLVIADDLTGAAELGGVAWRHGLSAEVQLDEPAPSPAAVRLVDMDTRRRTPFEAAQQIAALAGRLEGDVFLKVDSVLRGHPIIELAALLAASRKRKAILLPANPSLGRTIQDGVYRIHGRPLAETDFRFDPEYPLTCSDALGLLGAPANLPVRLGSVRTPEAGAGITLAQAETESDVLRWAQLVDDDTLPSGAADFFAAFLQTRGHRPCERALAPTSTEPTLLVSGSASAASREQIDQLRAQGAAVIAMPDTLYQSLEPLPGPLERWVQQIEAALAQARFAIACICRHPQQQTGRSKALTHLLALAAAAVLARRAVSELWLEGGATAAALIRHLGWRRLEVDAQLAPGVIRLCPLAQPRLRVVMKPGSYRWPQTR